jgi:hypothetical protein
MSRVFYIIVGDRLEVGTDWDESNS